MAKLLKAENACTECEAAVRLKIIRNARIKYVGKSGSCMVSQRDTAMAELTGEQAARRELTGGLASLRETIGTEQAANHRRSEVRALISPKM